MTLHYNSALPNIVCGAKIKMFVIFQNEGCKDFDINVCNSGEILIFCLRVAKDEHHNKMSASSLAIVFAPCILRTPNADDPFLGMKDVSKTTQ